MGLDGFDVFTVFTLEAPARAGAAPNSVFSLGDDPCIGAVRAGNEIAFSPFIWRWGAYDMSEKATANFLLGDGARGVLG